MNHPVLMDDARRLLSHYRGPGSLQRNFRDLLATDQTRHSLFLEAAVAGLLSVESASAEVTRRSH